MTKKQNNKRFKDHLYFSGYKNPQILIHHKIKQYGSEQFIFSIIFQTKDIEYAKQMESYFITEYCSLVPKGYNIHPGGNYRCVVLASDKVKQRMIKNNPGNTKESIIKKTSILEAKNHLTNEIIIVENRKQFSKKYQIPYTSIGWAIQNNKTLKCGWSFSYITKRTMGA